MSFVGFVVVEEVEEFLVVETLEDSHFRSQELVDGDVAAVPCCCCCCCWQLALVMAALAMGIGVGGVLVFLLPLSLLVMPVLAMGDG